MPASFSRRRFLHCGAAAGLGLGWTAACGSFAHAGEFSPGAPEAEKLGWRVGCTAWTFREHSFFESLKRLKSLGLRFMEGMSWQPVGAEFPGVQTNESMSKDVLRAIRRRLDDEGVTLVSCYLAELPNNEDVCRKRFEWAKQLGLEYFVAEPPLEAFDLLEKLCDEYRISLAIHNHPKPSSQYWDPAVVLKAVRNRSKRIGACADTGHWMRSGFMPAETLKTLEGRVIGFHVKDVVALNDVKAQEVPWGEGKGRIVDVFQEVLRQKMPKPFLGIEYERPGETRPEIARSLAFLNKTLAGMKPAR